MIEKIKFIFKKINPYGASAFFIPVLVMVAIYLSIGIYPGSDRSVLASDAFSQFSNFHASFNNVLHGKQSFFYTWNASLGLNYYALISYYLGGIFTPFVFFFDNSLMPDAMYFLTLIKIGSTALAFWFFAKETFKITPWSQVALAVAYSLMSFITAHSELIMWIDTFVYLPLIFLGINRIIAGRKPTLLFVSYFLLFISNFYFGFMVGILSVLYYLATVIIDWKNKKSSLLPYFVTSLLAGCASMIMILPTILDLTSNGETLSEVTKFKTEATAFWDIIMKNMVGIYDTTKYGSIPFIYVGLLPLIFCLFYFITKKVPLKNKIAYGAIFGIITASFYIVPLNLFWHGMHAPNMFLFRYSFTFSFMVIMLAGYGLEHFTKDDSPAFVGGTVALIGLYLVAFMVRGKDSYDFVTDQSFIVTILFLLLYLAAIIFYHFYRPNLNQTKKGLQMKQLGLILLILVTFEATINTHSMLNGILEDWRYASRSLYTDPYKDYKDSIDQVKALDQGPFYRMETLDPVSSNDGINYGFSGVSMFSSIRNRNTSAVMNDLGFRSRGTSLNIRYPNNTLLMDSLFGIKYNHAKEDPQKFGFKEVVKNKTYKMYQNESAMTLGTITNQDLYKTKFPKNDNLGSQTNLVNQLAGTNEAFFSFTTPVLVGSTNTTQTENNNNVTFKEIKPNIAKTITWEVEVPANKQAYISLFPTNFGELKSSSAEVTVGGKSRKTQVDITGQYYNLGYYAEKTVVSFNVSFYGTAEITLMKPPVVLLDIPAYTRAFAEIAEKQVPLEVSGRKVTGQLTAEKDEVLMTTIPYDQGWTAYLDGKKTEIKDFKNAFITIPLTAGTHELKLVFLPAGFKIGMLCLVIGIGGFILYLKFFFTHNSLPKASSTKGRRTKKER